MDSWFKYPLSIAASGIAALFSYHWYLSCQFADEPKVNWSWIPFLGNASEFGQYPIKFMLDLCKSTTDEIFGVILAGERIFFISDPNSYNFIIKSDKSKLSFDVFTRQVILNAFGVNLATLNHTEEHSIDDKARAQFQKYLLADSECDIITRRMQEKVVQLPGEILPAETNVVNMKEFIYSFVYKASIAAVFNNNLAENEAAYKGFLNFDSTFALAVAGVPGFAFPKSIQGRDKCVEELTVAQNNAGNLITERVKMFEGIDTPAVDTAKFQLAIMWASVGNTMPAAYWTMYYIISNSDALAAVSKELKEIYGGSIPDVQLRVKGADIARMAVLDSCISEALRLTSGSLMMRQVVHAEYSLTTASGRQYKFRKGDKIGIFPALTHYDADIFPDPHTFKYDRFLTLPSHVVKNNKQIATSACFLPFGGGIYYCPGRKFARNEIKTVLAYIFANYDCTITNPGPADREYDGSRAGLGIFPPKSDHLQLKLVAKTNQ